MTGAAASFTITPMSEFRRTGPYGLGGGASIRSTIFHPSAEARTPPNPLPGRGRICQGRPAAQAAYVEFPGIREYWGRWTGAEAKP